MKLSFFCLFIASGTYPYLALISICFTLWSFAWYNFLLQDSHNPPHTHIPQGYTFIVSKGFVLFFIMYLQSDTPLQSSVPLIDIWIDLRDSFGCGHGFLKTDGNCPGLEYWGGKKKETLLALRRAIVKLILLATLGGISSLGQRPSLPPEHPSHLANFHSPQGPRQKNKRGRK